MEMTEKLQLTWVAYDVEGNRLELDRVNLALISVTGVYIIWHGGQQPRVVRVGQGDVATRLGAHRVNNKIQSYSGEGVLYVTWAAVPARLLDGVELYLAEHWKPLVGDRFPDAVPVAVNSPWA